MRIYIRQHTPWKGIRLILDTVSRMKGRASQFDTSHLGTQCHTSLPLSSHNPHGVQWAPTTTIDDWPRAPTTWIDGWQWGPTNIYETHHQDWWTAMRTHHHHWWRPTARIDQWLQLPTTMIDKRPWAPTTINEWEIPIQTPMPAQMQRWTKHEPQPEHEYPPLRPYSWSEPQGEHLSLLSVRGIKGSVPGRGTELRHGEHHLYISIWLLKGRGGFPTPLLHSYFYIVGKYLSINMFFL